jgi:hypothetical protein
MISNSKSAGLIPLHQMQIHVNGAYIFGHERGWNLGCYRMFDRKGTLVETTGPNMVFIEMNQLFNIDRNPRDDCQGEWILKKIPEPKVWGYDQYEGLDGKTLLNLEPHMEQIFRKLWPGDGLSFNGNWVND